jgi:hypothetical protein
MSQLVNREVVAVKPYNLPRLYLTHDHPIKSAQGHFVPAGELVEGFEVVVPFDTTETPVDLTPLELRILGLWVAEGHYQRRRPDGGYFKIGFTLHPEEEGLAALIREWVRTLTNRHGNPATLTDTQKVDPRNGNTYRVIMVNSRVAADFVQQWTQGDRAREKALPATLLQATRTQQAYLLEGLKAGDGFSNAQREGEVHGYGTASTTLALQVQRILWRQGKVAGITCARQQGGWGKANTGTRYEIRWFNGESRVSRIEAGKFYSQIYQVNRHVDYTGPVYDLTIETTEEIPTVSGIVHNCKHCCFVVPGRVYREDAREPHGGTWRDFFRLAVELGLEQPENLSRWPREDLQSERPRVKRLPPEEAVEIWSQIFLQGYLTLEDTVRLQDRGIDPELAGFISSTPRLWEWIRGAFPSEDLVGAGLAYLRETGELRPTRCIHPGRVLIPYRRGREQALFHFVGYQKCPPLQPGQSPVNYEAFRDTWVKIAGPTGFSSRVYGEIPEGADYLIVTEGQIKALAAIQHGFPCVGLPGMGACHYDLLTMVLQAGVKRVLIVFDTQLSEEHERFDAQEEIDYEATRLAQSLLKHQVPTFRAQLPLNPQVDGGLKMDIDSYLRHYPVESFVQVLKRAYPYELESTLDLLKGYARG